MSKMKRKRRGIFRTSEQDADVTKHLPETPQTKSPSYRLAFSDQDFLLREELRPVRLQLELLKTEMILQERGINSTIAVFGSARIPKPGAKIQAKSKAAEKGLANNAKYYEEARKFAKLASKASKEFDYKEYVLVSGGGPGIMEAVNYGATQADAPSIGLNIVLPFEEAPNEYVTPELCFNFHYFALRKMHFLMRAKAAVSFPGGFGTFDELFETLTLIQTKRIDPMPVILFGEKFWNRVINFEALAEEGTISPEDVKLFHFVETAEEGWDIIAKQYDLPGSQD
ncbi:MAG: LOG family protein [Methyloligellaceae bacterium]